MENNQLVSSQYFIDAVAVEDLIKEYALNSMVEGTDFGTIPSTNKPTLLKPGAEKLLRLFKLRPKFILIDSIVDYDRPLFHYHYQCQLERLWQFVGEGDGVASSREKKYQRKSLICPECGQATVFKDKQSSTYYCWSKKGGCGARNLTEVNQVDEFDFSMVNTICKSLLELD